MKWVLRLAAMLAVLAGLFGAVLSFRRQRREIRIVRIEGVKACCNDSLSPLGWLTCQAENRPASLPLRDGDIVVAFFEREDGDEDMVFPYLAGDGTCLSFELEGSRLLMQGRTVSIKLWEDEGPWRWLQEAAPSQLARLRFLELRQEIEPSRMPILERLAAFNPRVGLMLDSEAAVGEVLPLFHPRWLLLDGPSLEEEGVEAVSSRRGVELLWIIDPDELESLDFLARLPRLRRLLISGWHPEVIPLPAGCASPESLTVFESDMEDLSPIAHLSGLCELHLAGCHSLTDISALSGFNRLEVLTLNGCKELSDLSALADLKALKWLGLPPGVTQEEFAAVVKELPDLRGLDLFGCGEITDLGPLTGLPELEFLVLLGPKADPAPLHGMKGLRLLVLPEDAFEEPAEEVRKLEEALPRCTVVAGGEICLGSGWILLLFPAAALAALILRRRRTQSTGKNA